MPEATQDDYPTWLGMVFVFNLIIGTGALTLPAAFARAGWLGGSVMVLLVGFISYVTVTFVIEAMASANAILHLRSVLKRRTARAGASDSDSDAAESSPLVSEEGTPFSLASRVEMGEMATIYFTGTGVAVFYLCLAIYLYGDLSIYAAAIGTSLKDVICAAGNVTDPHAPCWPDHSFTRIECYRACVVATGLLLGPFVFFNVQKTKYIQILTVIFRWCAFTSMIVMAVSRLIQDGVQGHPGPVIPTGIPSLFGTCIYSFMCHHSLPSLLAPVREKRHLTWTLPLDFILIAIFYILLALTGVFAFDKLDDLYTLNFLENPGEGFTRVIDYFLALFPVFTLSASLPIVAITLRNNLQAILVAGRRNSVTCRALLPLLALLPAFAVTLLTDSLSSLVGFTGTYAGAGVQYITPVALVYCARRQISALMPSSPNPHRSPFQGNKWLLLVVIWCALGVVLVTVNFFTSVAHPP
ncbi:transmembrane protein 104 homolog [Phlebotomus argentipes]|uniref:transmembrane protein 104 homolog n=1 Tax=Phlebotomus argentipes TaxID=94469 RepID=UPI002892D5D6|nr:transmembrane protein 104 homolog [Phlebotomus argentipes]